MATARLVIGSPAVAAALHKSIGSVMRAAAPHMGIGFMVEAAAPLQGIGSGALVATVCRNNNLLRNDYLWEEW